MTLLLMMMLGGCASDLDRVEEGEWLPGGSTTNIVMTGINSFLLPSSNLDPEDEQDFFSGNAFFNQAWVEAPASTEARDGLGPLFNARSCSGCHFRDGRGAPPESGEAPFVGVLLRLSVPGADGPAPDPVYGSQLQDQALPDHAPEALPRITTTTVSGTLDDGTPYELAAPTYHLDEPGYGPFPADLMVSPRVAPHMIGLGLLEAIDEADILALEDPDDADGDGISGRAQRYEGTLGRFGWKADAHDIPTQVAAAFAGDMGLTTSLHPLDDCTLDQPDCVDAASGGEPEITDRIFDLVVLYSRTVAPPARRNADDPDVLAGKRLFHKTGCVDCHTPSYVTGAFPALPAMAGQRIWPYTDLLLHDMGPDLADDRPVGDASGREWKTPPLWGLGLIDEVSGHTRFLHDGRARSLEEAILWHGGEAEEARQRYTELTAEEREQLLAFVEDL